jgi:hypothetical protein
MEKFKNVVVLRTDRRGRDPDTYWLALTFELFDTLDPLDPWKELSVYISNKHPDVLSPYFSSRKEMDIWLVKNRYRCKTTQYAIGY